MQLESKLRPSLVYVEVEVPHVCLIDGVHSRSFYGIGLVVHHSEKVGPCWGADARDGCVVVAALISVHGAWHLLVSCA